MQIPLDLNRSKSLPSKTEVRSLIWAPHCSYRAEASQRIMWKMLFQHKCNWFTNCNLASFFWERGHGVLGSLLWFAGQQGQRDHEQQLSPGSRTTWQGICACLKLCSLEQCPYLSQNYTKALSSNTGSPLSSSLALVYPFISRWWLEHSPLILWLTSGKLKPKLNKHRIIWHWHDSW